MANPGYANLLAHLNNPSTPLPLPTIQSALAHHLAKLAPLPTPLAAIAVSSPLFLAHPFTHPKLQTLFTAFRHATHLKFRDSKKAGQSALSSMFAMSPRARMKHWAAAVAKGIKGGKPILRLACYGGLLAGLEDLKIAKNLEIERSKLEDELVIALAECMDTYSHSASTSSGWETEFQPVGDVDTMTLALISASQSLALVVPRKLKVLPLSMLLGLLTFSVTSAFASGTFLSTASSSTSREATPTSTTLRTINNSPLMEFIAPISKLTGLIMTTLCDSRPSEGISAAAAALEALRPVAKSLESDWMGGASVNLAGNENLDTPERTVSVWTTLKTLLFANIMIADAALSSAVFIPPAAYSGTGPMPSTLAVTVLQTLSNLSFVVSQFGGVTTTASPGFVELKKTFYLALDILAKSEDESGRFVRELYREWQGYKEDLNPDVQAKKAYALTCIEQLVPVLTGDYIQLYALPLALPQLSDPSDREVYESSHSVILALFASHADHHATGQDQTTAPGQGPRLTERMVPFYAHCLIENSIDGRLNTPQLRLAFASLVRSACASGHSLDLTRGDTADMYALAWYCIDALLAAIHDLSLSRDSGRSTSTVDEQLHRLHLTLISVVPTLPLKLLPRVLDEVKAVLAGHGAQTDSGKAKELIDATFVEISERAGDREKEYVMRWWYDNRSSFSGKVKEGVGMAHAHDSENQSRL
ncbi:hypothetical protein B0H15DRAFT_612967 [Mycena belliarum]|uniref:Uncharacterized protein n=1 Tax=Mycena belliarum TaxID=1033014 RepID=A0AAD6TQ93_9AGAR|nr:hypothetical protein B0H15DRAFT_612967 [Mycena belliae]